MSTSHTCRNENVTSKLVNTGFLLFIQIEECHEKIEAKKKELEKLQERERNIHSSFFASLGENNKFADYLTKVFKKKIKRFKKKETEGKMFFTV